MQDRQTLAIFAVTALLSAILGSIVSYVGERTISNDAHTHEEQRQQNEDHGIARLYKEQIDEAVNALAVDYERGHWPTTAELRLFELPSAEDRSRIQALLSPKAAVVVREADRCVQDVDVAINSFSAQELSEENKEFVASYIVHLRNGSAALESLTDEKPKASRTKTRR